MEFIPEAGTSLKINDYPIEIMQVKNNMVKTARISLPSDREITDIQSEPD
jgi:Mg2+/Co2+ transporter CorB